MLKQLRQMQKDLQKAQKQLAKENVSAEAEDGAIRVTITGDQRVTELHINEELIANTDAAKLASILQKTFNQALEESRNLAQERLGPLSSGLNF